jgi:type II secretion system protein J
MKPARSTRNEVCGFTLLEMILAVGVAAIVLMAVSAAFFTALHLQASTQAAVDAATPVDQALAVLRRDLQCVVTPTNGTSKMLSGDFKIGQVFSPGLIVPAAIEMYTATGALSSAPDAPWGDIQRVTYELERPADRSAPGMELVRSVTRNLLSTVTPDVENQPLLSGVGNIQFSCYDGAQWYNTWDTTDPTAGNTNLPLAVRVQIQMVGDNNAASGRSAIEILVPLDSQARTNAVLAAANSGS